MYESTRCSSLVVLKAAPMMFENGFSAENSFESNPLILLSAKIIGENDLMMSLI
jgi:hypothetical protein